jgi:hypothetical protein
MGCRSVQGADLTEGADHPPGFYLESLQASTFSSPRRSSKPKPKTKARRTNYRWSVKNV